MPSNTNSFNNKLNKKIKIGNANIKSKGKKLASNKKKVLRIHYHSRSLVGFYDQIYMWAWNSWSIEKNFPSTSSDDFGAIFDIPLDLFTNLKKMGFKFKLGEGLNGPWYDFDRYWDPRKDPEEIWIVSGSSVLYSSIESAVKPRMVSVLWEGFNEIKVTLADEYLEKYSCDSFLLNNDASIISVHSVQNIIYIKTTELSIQKNYVLTFLSRYGLVRSLLYPNKVMDCFITDERLGSYYDQEKNATCFKIWSPRATSIQIYISKTENDKPIGTFPLIRNSFTGVWSVLVSSNLHGLYYWYKIDGPKELGEEFNKSLDINDPYSYVALSSWKNGSISAGRSQVVDLNKISKPIILEKPKISDLVIYELHIKDMTSHQSSGCRLGFNGTYLAISQTQTKITLPTTSNTSFFENEYDCSTGIDHLKYLGVNAVQILPVHEFPWSKDKYFWGYMTANFFSISSHYATKDGFQKVIEFKEMVDSFHKNGILVILDVVFNHTAEGNEKGDIINFKGIDSKYYYRRNPITCEYYNGSGAGNEIATERYMVRKFIIDCLKYYRDVFGIDGFRFDLLALFDLDTISEISKELPDVYLYGEPWASSRANWGKGALNHVKPWFVFNDDFRNSVKGSPEGDSDIGFIGGYGDIPSLRSAILGNTSGKNAWADTPCDGLLYLDVHDNLLLSDKLEVCLAALSESERKMRVKIAGMLLLTSLGPVLLCSGVELLRSKVFFKEGDGRAIKSASGDKSFDANSYQSSLNTNAIDWRYKLVYQDVYTYFCGLIKFRNSTYAKACKLPIKPSDEYAIWHGDINCHYAVGYTLNNDRSFGKHKVRVLINSSNHHSVKFDVSFLEKDHWCLIANSTKISIDGLKKIRQLSSVVLEPLEMNLYISNFYDEDVG